MVSRGYFKVDSISGVCMPLWGDRVREERQTMGLTQEEFAERIAVHPRQIHRYESGNTYLDGDIVGKLPLSLLGTGVPLAPPTPHPPLLHRFLRVYSPADLLPPKIFPRLKTTSKRRLKTGLYKPCTKSVTTLYKKQGYQKSHESSVLIGLFSIGRVSYMIHLGKSSDTEHLEFYWVRG